MVFIMEKMRQKTLLKHFRDQIEAERQALETTKTDIMESVLSNLKQILEIAQIQFRECENYIAPLQCCILNSSNAVILQNQLQNFVKELDKKIAFEETLYLQSIFLQTRFLLEENANPKMAKLYLELAMHAEEISNIIPVEKIFD